MYILDPNQNIFPDFIQSTHFGLAAIGGNLSTEAMLDAYGKGYFPWFNPGEEIEWYNPDPRCVIFPETLHIAKSMRTYLNGNKFKFTVNKDFFGVLKNCGHAPRNGQDGTWIGEEIIESYTNLYNKGYALSAEAWNGDKLVGGLYGMRLGKVFFGESMFSLEKNASKFAFIKMVHYLQKKHDIQLIDCQIETPHLISLGSNLIARDDFKLMLLHWVHGG